MLNPKLNLFGRDYLNSREYICDFDQIDRDIFSSTNFSGSLQWASPKQSV